MNFITQYYGLKRELYIIFIIRFFVALGSLVSPMFVLLMSTKLGYDMTTISYVFALSTSLSLPASIIGGWIADRYSRKNIIIIFELVNVALFSIAAFLPLSHFTVIAVMAAGFFSNIQGPASTALTTDFSRPHERDRAFSMGYLGFNLGFIFAPTIAGLLFRSNLWLNFALNAAAIFLSAIIIYLFIDEKKSFRFQPHDEQQKINEYEASSDSDNTLRVMSTRLIVFMVIGASYVTGLLYSVVGFITPLQLESQFAEQGSLYYGMLTSFNAIIVIAVTPFMTILIRKFKDLTKLFIALALLMGAMLMFGTSNLLFLYFVAMLLYTLGEIFNTIGYLPYITKRIPASHRGRIFGLVGIIGTVVAVLSNLLVGFAVQNYGYPIAWSIYFGIGIIGLVLYWIAMPIDKRKFKNLY